VGIREEQRPLGRPMRSREDNIKMDLKNWDVGMEWIGLLQDRDRMQVVVNAGNFSTN
jgi:hypothetical protein